MSNYYIIESPTRGVFMEWGTSTGSDGPRFSREKKRTEARKFHTASGATAYMQAKRGFPANAYVTEMPSGVKVVGDGSGDVSCTTTIRKNGVHYTVSNGGVLVWERIVHFGTDKLHRPGGFAFREAAREQDRIAGPRYIETIGREEM